MKMVSKSTAVYVALFVLLLFWAYFVQADTRRVDGISMKPPLEGGDLVVIQQVPIGDLKVGDIIVYGPPCSTFGISVVHRVVNITGAGPITKGDNNPSADPAEGIAYGAITQQCLEGKVVFIIPYVEILAYYIDYYNLPQWFYFIPSIVLLAIVFYSVLGRTEEKEDDRPGRRTAEAGAS